jgi:ABC-type sugar transport system ATPase subunit
MPHLPDAGEEPSGHPTAGTVLRVRGLRKRFGSLRVLRGVDLDLGAGEILALVGENGAGKSTLVQCLAGAAKADGGRIELLASGSDSSAGRANRIAVVWQDLALCDNLSATRTSSWGTSAAQPAAGRSRDGRRRPPVVRPTTDRDR